MVGPRSGRRSSSGGAHGGRGTFVALAGGPESEFVLIPTATETDRST